MSQQVQDFQRPEVFNDKRREELDLDSDRYGILVGGMKQIYWDGIGENSVGHHIINRRIWVPFTRLRVGIRPEYDGALSLPENVVQVNWGDAPERLKWKTPHACAMDVLATYKEKGFCVPNVLVGHPDPASLTERVWPREVRDQFRLIDQIPYFENFSTNDGQEGSLVSELLESCYLCRNWLMEYVPALREEVNDDKGLKNLNSALKELFFEMGEPLPEQKTALVAQAMGNEIVKAQKGDGRKDDAMINVLDKIAARLEKLESAASKPSEEQETANTKGRK
jgi:hypothetical protein